MQLYQYSKALPGNVKGQVSRASRLFPLQLLKGCCAFSEIIPYPGLFTHILLIQMYQQYGNLQLLKQINLLIMVRSHDSQRGTISNFIYKNQKHNHTFIHNHPTRHGELLRSKDNMTSLKNNDFVCTGIRIYHHCQWQINTKYKT